MTKSATRIQDKDTQKRVSVVQSKEDPSKYGVVILNPDGTPIRGKQGEPGEAATIAVGTTTTGQPGTSASVTNSGTSSAAVFNFTIPEGEQGEQGETGNGIASVTSSKSGKTTTITVSYTDGSTPYSFQILDGADGQGSGDVLGPSSSTQGHLATFADGTGKVIQDGGAIPVVPTNVSAFTNDSGYVTSSIVSDTAYGSSWDGVTGTAPSKNAVYDKINGIDGLIPSAATSSNKLVDKNYVDDSINSVTAYYITKNAAGDQFATYAELAAATTFYSGGVQRTPTRNDYCIVLDDENHDHATTRYIYNTNWEYQYTVNETALTTAQINALNSGITSAKVTTYDGYASTISGKQDALSTQTAYTSKGTSTKVPQITTNTLGQVTGITEVNIDFPDTSNVKSFTLSSTSDLTNAQAIYDWTSAGKSAIVMYDSDAYLFESDINSQLTFKRIRPGDTNQNTSGITQSVDKKIILAYSSGEVTSIMTASATTNDMKYLRTDVDYTTAYTPTYNGSPATKKYVDDHGVPAVGSNGQVLTVVSGAAAWANPAGGDVQVSTQANNILTTGTKLRAGTESDYSNLGTYDSNTIYLTV